VALLADLVGFAEPGENFAVHFLARIETEGMHVVARRDVFNLGETRIFRAPVQHDVTNESIAPEAHGGETHAHLKCDARFFGQDARTAAALHEFGEFPEQS